MWAYAPHCWSFCSCSTAWVQAMHGCDGRCPRTVSSATVQGNGRAFAAVAGTLSLPQVQTLQADRQTSVWHTPNVWHVSARTEVYDAYTMHRQDCVVHAQTKGVSAVSLALATKSLHRPLRNAQSTLLRGKNVIVGVRAGTTLHTGWFGSAMMPGWQRLCVRRKLQHNR